MVKSTDDLVEDLLNRIFTTKGLKEISAILEDLSRNKTFKHHVSVIVEDKTLTDAQKRRQLFYVLKFVEDTVLLDFFEEVLSGNNLWLFTKTKIDYFDTFVQKFQKKTEDLGLIYMVTAIELTAAELEEIAKDLSKAFGYKVVIKHEINPNILGGAQVRVENLVFDFSLKTKFQQFQRAWILSLNKTEKLVGRNQSEHVL